MKFVAVLPLDYQYYLNSYTGNLFIDIDTTIRPYLENYLNKPRE